MTFNTDGGREREDHVVVVHRQEVGLPGLQPALGRSSLALGAMAVAAGVVGHLIVLAAWAMQNVSPQRRGAALLDGCHDLELTQAQVGALGNPKGWPVGAEDVRDLQGTWPHVSDL